MESYVVYELGLEALEFWIYFAKNIYIGFKIWKIEFKLVLKNLTKTFFNVKIETKGSFIKEKYANIGTYQV
jgi:hypothetical protein